ncbi:MAG: hypothetical protein R2772_04795 [Chitinophagales bacterium]
MNYQEEIEDFVIRGFNKVNSEPGYLKSFVLKNKEDNFINKPSSDFDYHRWANSLKSSQAFAHNIFSGVQNPTLIFEFHMEVFNRDAQIDVKIENELTIELFEVKAFEIIKMEEIDFAPKYFNKEEYKQADLADAFIDFLYDVKNAFAKEYNKIYGGGIKQLCSHLLGIINSLDKVEYQRKNFKLYSLCLDNNFTPRFERDLTNYKTTITKFKKLVDAFLKKNNLHLRIEYYGFLSAREYISKNKELLGQKNYDYVMNRYFS